MRPGTAGRRDDILWVSANGLKPRRVTLILIRVARLSSEGIKQMDEKHSVTGPRTRKVLAGANFAVYTLAVIAIAALANWFVDRNDKTWDLTPNKSYSLSPQTIKLLRGLDRDVIVYVFEQKQRMREGHDLLDNYASTSRRLTVKYVDADGEPVLAKHFAVRSYGTIVVAACYLPFQAQ